MFLFAPPNDPRFSSQRHVQPGHDEMSPAVRCNRRLSVLNDPLVSERRG